MSMQHVRGKHKRNSRRLFQGRILGREHSVRGVSWSQAYYEPSGEKGMAQALQFERGGRSRSRYD